MASGTMQPGAHSFQSMARWSGIGNVYAGNGTELIVHFISMSCIEEYSESTM